MQILKLSIMAATIAGSLTVAAAPAAAQRDGWRDRDGRWHDNGRHRGWRHGRWHRVCQWRWRHHHRVRVCWRTRR